MIENGGSALRVGFLLMGGAHWTGGITYLRNMLRALQSNHPNRITPVLLLRADQDIKDYSILVELKVQVEMVHTRGFRGSRMWEGVRQGVYLVCGDDMLNRKAYNTVIKRCGLDVLFGANLAGHFDVPTICWFPDFQHIHLPQNFSMQYRMGLNLMLSRMARNARRMVFSSDNAKADFTRLYPCRAAKAIVLRFVADLPAIKQFDGRLLRERHGLPEKFAYLPNQFWKHKDHLTVFAAVKSLRDRGFDICVACSGNTRDPRNPEHYQRLLSFIDLHQLGSHVKMLGMVPFPDVYPLIAESCFLVNPSTFEGWSTSVEEARVLGKPMVLSAIPVHLEQSPPRTLYFETGNAQDLARILIEAWGSSSSGRNMTQEASAAATQVKSARVFSDEFLRIVTEAAAPAAAN